MDWQRLQHILHKIKLRSVGFYLKISKCSFLQTVYKRNTHNKNTMRNNASVNTYWDRNKISQIFFPSRQLPQPSATMVFHSSNVSAWQDPSQHRRILSDVPISTAPQRCAPWILLLPSTHSALRRVCGRCGNAVGAFCFALSQTPCHWACMCTAFALLQWKPFVMKQSRTPQQPPSAALSERFIQGPNPLLPTLTRARWRCCRKGGKKNPLHGWNSTCST